VNCVTLLSVSDLGGGGMTVFPFPNREAVAYGSARSLCDRMSSAIQSASPF